MGDSIEQQGQVTPEMAGERLDAVAARLFPDFSRSRLQAWIKEGQLTLNGRVCRPRDKVSPGQTLSLSAEPVQEVHWRPQDIELDILYEDESIIVLDKPAGLVVHPAAGHADGTLVNALLAFAPELAELPRGGVVHRLDKDTSGVMVVARTLQAHHHLVEQLQQRTVSRQYSAVCIGTMTGGGTIDAPLGRHPRQRKKMAVVAQGGKTAITHYRLVERFAHHTHVAVKLETGRTHQIRVHMAHRKFPLVGDPAYGGRPRIPKGASEELIATLRGFPRQALHAEELGLLHPVTEELVSFSSALPADMQQLLTVLRNDDPPGRSDDPAY